MNELVLSEAHLDYESVEAYLLPRRHAEKFRYIPQVLQIALKVLIRQRLWLAIEYGIGTFAALTTGIELILRNTIYAAAVRANDMQRVTHASGFDPKLWIKFTL